jgi:hypothetical protein
MKLNNLQISKEKLDINFKFYLFLKELNSTTGVKEKEINKLLSLYYLHIKSDYKNIISLFQIELETIKNYDRLHSLSSLLLIISDSIDFFLFIFALKLLQIKPLILQEAKYINYSHVIENKNTHPLSIEYDKIGKNTAYYTRVNGALISLIFFQHLENNNINFIKDANSFYLKDLIKDYHQVKSYKVEPNQIFMLMFSETINQSIKSDAGISYEDRIYNILISLGINKNNIKKVHDLADKSTEFDFFFEIDNISYGIGAKRTLRERYKQFIKTSITSQIDIMIEITLGLDLTLEKAKTISQHGVYIFVADEIYFSRDYLKILPNIYPASNLTINTLKSLKKLPLN